MSKYSEYFLNSPHSSVRLELIEISHPSFSKVYRIVRNSYKGVTVTIDSAPVFFEYYPLQITKLTSNETLDQSIKISLGDLGEVIPLELDRMRIANQTNIKPILRYWEFSSDDLLEPLIGPFTLEIKSMLMTENGSAFEASAPTISVNKTGQLYRTSRFSGLKVLV